MRIPFGNLAEIGVIKDVEDYLLPLNAWTDARNVRLQDGKLVRFTGHQEALAGSPIAPYWLMHCFDLGSNSHWMVCGLGKVYDYSSGAYTDITKLATTYGATATELWNGGVLGNIPIINNGADKPQMWAPVAAATKLIDLTNWPATHLAAVVKPFKNFLFALDITEGGTRFPHRVRVSHPAVPGAVPSSWDDTDATKDVYVQDLSDFGAGRLIDCLPMRDVNVLYKERSTWGMQFVGGTSKWRLFPILEETGMFERHCGVSFAENSMHFVGAGDDVIIHNGQTPTSLLNKRQKRWLLANIDTTNYNRSFAVHNPSENECWFCFPLTGSTWPNLAMVWNYRENCLFFREIDLFSFIAQGQIPLLSNDPWDSDTGSWDSDFSRWDNFTHPPFVRRLLAARPDTSKMFHQDYTDQFNLISFNAYIERTGIDAIAVKANEVVHDREMFRLVKRVYMQADGAPFQVQLATQQEIEGPVTWGTAETFTPGVDKFVDFESTVATQLWGLRFSSMNNAGWQIHSIEADVEPLGQF